MLIKYWLIAALVISAQGLYTDEPPVSRGPVTHIVLRTDYLEIGERQSPFDEINVRKNRGACELLYVSGRKYTKQALFSRQAILTTKECASVWALIEPEAIASFKSSYHSEPSKRRRTYQLVLFSDDVHRETGGRSSLRIYWDTTVNEKEFLKIRPLVEKLQSFKKRLQR